MFDPWCKGDNIQIEVCSKTTDVSDSSLTKKKNNNRDIVGSEQLSPYLNAPVLVHLYVIKWGQ